MDALFVSVGSRGVMCCVGRKWLDACETSFGAPRTWPIKANGAGELSGMDAEVRSI